MTFPDYFSQVPAITLRDPLAELLGAAEGGLLEYRFADAVRLAGHACPTVAGAWLMTTHALRALYGAAMPVRGEIRVALGENLTDGVAGVIASVAGLITGAAADGGFKGLGGRYGRRNLLQFGIDGVAGLRLTRLDSGATVNANFRPNSVPADPELPILLGLIVNGRASAEEKQGFARLWQDRVRRILIDHGNDPALISLQVAS